MKEHKNDEKFYREFVCEWCKIEIKQQVEHIWQAKYKRKFCSRSCSNKYMFSIGVLNSKGENNPMFGKSVSQVWKDKFGEEKALELQKDRIENSRNASLGERNSMYGKHHSDESRQKMSEFRSGKTIEELWGEERAADYRKELSERVSGKGNPMYGKTSTGGRSIKGYYKNHFFRSLLEYSFMKHLEKQGFSLDLDVKYETVLIPVDDKSTYRPDFLIPVSKELIEVKPFYASKSIINQKKFNATQIFCQNLGMKFSVMTERDFEKIKFEDAKNDPDIVFDERTFEYFRKA